MPSHSYKFAARVEIEDLEVEDLIERKLPCVSL